MSVEDLSDSAKGSLVYGSMSGGNDVSVTPYLSGPGSASQQVADTDARPQPDPVPPVTVNEHVAGLNAHGGNLHAEGVVPRSDGPWTQANSAAGGDGDSKWTTERVVYDWQNI